MTLDDQFEKVPLPMESLLHRLAIRGNLHQNSLSPSGAPEKKTLLLVCADSAQKAVLLRLLADSSYLVLSCGTLLQGLNLLTVLPQIAALLLPCAQMGEERVQMLEEISTRCPNLPVLLIPTGRRQTPMQGATPHEKWSSLPGSLTKKKLLQSIAALLHEGKPAEPQKKRTRQSANVVPFARTAKQRAQQFKFR